MVEVLGFFLVLAALALMIGTLAQGPLRMTGFIVLALIAVLASGPMLQRISFASFFNSWGSPYQDDAIQSPANLPSSPVPAAPAYGGGEQSQSGTNSANGGGSTSSTSSPNRGIRGGW